MKRITHEILARFKPARLVLFGSYARGDVHEGSDADFLVVADFKEKFFDRIGKILDLREGALEVDVLAYTPEEFEKMVKQRNSLIARALREGISIA